jgi:thiol:disulfide interchange protein DsbC
MKRHIAVALLGLLCLLAVPASAGDASEQVRASLRVLIPHLKVDSVRPTPIANLYEVTFGSHIIYVTADGKYMVQGRITDLETRESITGRRQQALKKAVIDRLDEKDMIIYGDKDLPYTVTVFTDIDCGFCRRLHSQIEEYNRLGIRIRYLAFPRAEPGSPSERAAVAVWCADDRKAAMTRAKQGKPVPYRDCKNPVRAEYELGEDFGVSGTPALVLASGEMIPGYLPPAKLRAVLDQRKAEQQRH